MDTGRAKRPPARLSFRKDLDPQSSAFGQCPSVTGRRVVVTGLGIISPLGLNVAETWNSLKEGRPGIGPIEGVDCSGLRFQNGAEVRRL